MLKPVTLLLVILVTAGLLSTGMAVLSTQVGPADGPAAAGMGEPPVSGTVADFTLFERPRPAPAQAFTDGAGRAVRLADFRGQVVLLNFWATWCAPCVAEMPSLDRLQARLGGRGLAVLPLSQDHKGVEVVTPFYDRLDLSHLGVYLDPRGEVGRAFEVRGLPTTVLVDRHGMSVGILTGPAEWDSPEAVALIEHYLAAPPPADTDLIRTGG